MQEKILQEEKEDILNDIISDKISIKIEKNEDNTFNLNFIEKGTKKVVYDNYKLNYNKDISNLNLATLSLLILSELEPDKRYQENKILTKESFSLNGEYKKLDNIVSFCPEDLAQKTNSRSYDDSFYSKNLETILSKISTSYDALPKSEYEDKTPGVYHFNDGSAIHLKRRVISGSDGPADCGAVLFATSNAEQLKEYLVDRYSGFGQEKEIKKSFADKKPSNLQAALDYVFGKKENQNGRVISFNEDAMNKIRENAYQVNSESNNKRNN